MKEEAKRYADKYKEMNDMLKLQNEEKVTQLREK